LTQIPRLTVRPATVNDVPILLEFIQGIAAYENLTHQVTATEKALLETLFGKPPAAEALLAFSDDEPAGFAVYFHTYSTFLARRSMYLEDLYVSPEYRRLGLGTLLLRRVATIAVERGCGRFEWAALDWNTDAHRFYKGLGAEMLPDWRLFRIQGDALRRLAEDEEGPMLQVKG
jgi:GNAT superfamily N-acetyltransferase